MRGGLPSLTGQNHQKLALTMVKPVVWEARQFVTDSKHPALTITQPETTMWRDITSFRSDQGAIIVSAITVYKQLEDGPLLTIVEMSADSCVTVPFLA